VETIETVRVARSGTAITTVTIATTSARVEALAHRRRPATVTAANLDARSERERAVVTRATIVLVTTEAAVLSVVMIALVTTGVAVPRRTRVSACILADFSLCVWGGGGGGLFVRGYICRLLNDFRSLGEVTLELVTIPSRGRSQQSTSQISCLFQCVLCFTCFSLGTSQPLGYNNINTSGTFLDRTPGLGFVELGNLESNEFVQKSRCTCPDQALKQLRTSELMRSLLICSCGILEFGTWNRTTWEL